MPTSVESGYIVWPRGRIAAPYPVLEAQEIGNVVVVLYDYMAFPRFGPARNLFAYSAETGEELWRAEDIGFGQTDAYTNILSELPLLVGNFCGYACEIDPSSGQVIRKEFTK